MKATESELLESDQVAAPPAADAGPAAPVGIRGDDETFDFLFDDPPVAAAPCSASAVPPVAAAAPGSASGSVPVPQSRRQAAAADTGADDTRTRSRSRSPPWRTRGPRGPSGPSVVVAALLPRLERPQAPNFWSDCLHAVLSMVAEPEDFVLRKPKEPILMELQCAGMAGEVKAIKKLGYDVTVIGCAEKKTSAQRFLRYTYGSDIRHMFTDNAAFMNGQGSCHMCRSATCPVSPRRPHLATAGFPCPPFSRARCRTGGTERTGKTESHPDFVLVMIQFEQYLRARVPYMFWVEEVLGFLSELSALEGRSPCAVLVEQLGRIGYSCEAVKLDHELWIRNTRGRVWLIGCHRDAGGAAGARAARDIVVKAHAKLLEMNGSINPTPGVLDVVDITSHRERQRMGQAAQAIHNYNYLLFF